MAWTYEYGVVTSASPEAVYNRWTTMANWSEDERWTPRLDRADVERMCRNWAKAVSRTLDWVDQDVV